MANEPAIRVENLGKLYHIGTKRQGYKTFRETVSGLFRTRPVGKKVKEEPFWALKNVSFEIKRGEVVGVIGQNGAGKSTLLKILSRITEPTEGLAEIHGRVGSLLEVGTGFHPELTGRENVSLNAVILGMPRAQISAKFDEIVAFAEVEKFIDTPVKHYSSGMYLRLAFSVAAHLEMEILLIDEVLAVGDIAFQKKCLGKMEDVAKQGRTVLFVSHNMAAIRSLCARAMVLQEGHVNHVGDVRESVEKYYRAIGAFGQSELNDPQGKGACGCFGRIKLHDGTGNTIEQGRGFQLSTTLTIDREISGFSMFCILQDMQGRMIFHLREESPALGLRAIQEMTWNIGVEFPPLWLNAGMYSVHFKVLFWGDSGSSRYVSDFFPLDVQGVSSKVQSILHPQVIWLVSR